MAGGVVAGGGPPAQSAGPSGSPGAAISVAVVVLSLGGGGGSGGGVSGLADVGLAKVFLDGLLVVVQKFAHDGSNQLGVFWAVERTMAGQQPAGGGGTATNHAEMAPELREKQRKREKKN